MENPSSLIWLRARWRSLRFETAISSVRSSRDLDVTQRGRRRRFRTPGRPEPRDRRRRRFVRFTAESVLRSGAEKHALSARNAAASDARHATDDDGVRLRKPEPESKQTQNLSPAVRDSYVQHTPTRGEFRRYACAHVARRYAVNSVPKRESLYRR
ncbi:hypothetical protein PUN28_000629 [Cardiocondyla obscurior]|uniref:Uncharacterized protein n=1 Tax=Cardiocondyla obscurior TaxID=286306 RepID=A0AAW2H0V5_9HYME